MKSIFTVSALAATALLTSICGSAEAIGIAITNFSFETDATPNLDAGGNFSVGQPFGFTGTGTTGTFSPATVTFATIPNGTKTGYVNAGGSLTQSSLGSILANTLYTFNAFGGNRANQIGGFAYSINLLAGATVIATATNSAADGAFSSSTVTFNTFSDSTFNGSVLGIRLVSTGAEQVNFDNLSLDASPVPFDFSPNLAIGVLGGAWAIKKFLKKKAV